MTRLIPFILLLGAPLFSLADFDLREELDPEVYQESGLEKLSPDELARLNVAVAELLGKREAKVLEESEIPQGEDRFGLETIKSRVASMFQSAGPERIESRIVGEFKGWGGNSKFVLENGQIWQQSDKSRFVSRKMDSPMVDIRRGALGSYLLKVEGYNSSVKVKRIQ
jgi:hypothetical protein